MASRPTLETPLTRLLGIDTPVLLAGMNVRRQRSRSALRAAEPCSRARARLPSVAAGPRSPCRSLATLRAGYINITVTRHPARRLYYTHPGAPTGMAACSRWGGVYNDIAAPALRLHGPPRQNLWRHLPLCGAATQHVNSPPSPACGGLRLKLTGLAQNLQLVGPVV
jgi:hypothetical protein